MRAFLYVPNEAGKAAIAAEGGVSAHEYFAVKQPCGRLKLHHNSKFIYVQQDGLLELITTRAFAATNFVIFYMFSTVFLKLGLLDMHRLDEHLDEADEYFLRIDIDFLKTFVVDVHQNQLSELLSRYAPNASFRTDSTAQDVIETLRDDHHCSHPCLVACFAPKFQQDLVTHSNAMYMKLGSLFDGDPMCSLTAEYMEFVIHTLDQSRKLYKDPQRQVDDLAAAQCADGTLVFNFQDVDAFDKWRGCKVIDMTLHDTCPPFQWTEPNQPSRCKPHRKTPTTPNPYPLMCPHPRSVRAPLMQDLKRTLPQDEYQTLKVLLRSQMKDHLMEMNHKLWYYRSKSLQIASSYQTLIQSTTAETLKNVTVARVRDELLREVQGLLTELKRAFRRLELIPVV